MVRRSQRAIFPVFWLPLQVAWEPLCGLPGLFSFSSASLPCSLMVLGARQEMSRQWNFPFLTPHRRRQ